MTYFYPLSIVVIYIEQKLKAFPLQTNMAGVLQSFETEIATLSISLLVFMAAASLFITIAEGSTMEIAGLPKPPVINTTEVFEDNVKPLSPGEQITRAMFVISHRIEDMEEQVTTNHIF
jgi:hypothetical protein